MSMKDTVKRNFVLNATKVVKIKNPNPQFKLRIRILFRSKKIVGLGLPSLLVNNDSNI